MIFWPLLQHSLVVSPPPASKPVPPPLEVFFSCIRAQSGLTPCDLRSLNHWTITEVPKSKAIFFFLVSLCGTDHVILDSNSPLLYIRLRPPPHAAQLARGRICVPSGLLGSDSLSFPAQLSRRWRDLFSKRCLRGLPWGSLRPKPSLCCPSKDAPWVSIQAQVSAWQGPCLCRVSAPGNGFLIPGHRTSGRPLCPVAIWTSATQSVAPELCWLTDCCYLKTGTGGSH